MPSERQKRALAAETAEESIAERLDAGSPLAGHAARGFASIVSGRLASQVAQFLASIVLARLLLPSAYGLVAITWTVTGFASLFSDLGLSAALVQSPRMTERDAATAFVINEATGLMMTLIVVLLRHPLANLLGQPRVAPLLALASLTFTLTLNVVPFAILERQMQFGKVAAIDIGCTLFGLAVSITCAAAGVGAESLVIGPLATAATASIAALAAARWVPKAWPSRRCARRLMAFGGHLTGFNVLGYWARNADNLLLGRFAGTTQLGLYNRAYMLMLLPLSQVGGVLGRVLLPLLSNMQNDLPRLRRAVLRIVKTTSLLVSPVLFGLAAVAHNFVLVAFGAHWRGAIPLIVILAIAGVPQVFGIVSAQVCQAVGQPRVLSTWGAVWNLSAVVAIVAGLHWGAVGVATALAIRGWLVIPIEMMPARLTIGIGAIHVIRTTRRTLAAAITMAVVVALLGAAFSEVMPAAAGLVLQVLLGAGIYIGLIAATDRTAFDDALILVRQRRLRSEEMTGGPGSPSLVDANDAFVKGMEFERRDDLPAAEQAYRAADQSGHAAAAVNLGMLLEELDDTEGAMQAFRRADQRGAAMGAFRLAWLLEEGGDLVGAEQAYRRAQLRGHRAARANLRMMLVHRGNGKAPPSGGVRLTNARRADDGEPNNGEAATP